MNATFQLDTLTTLVIGESAEHMVYHAPSGLNMPPTVPLGLIVRVPTLDDFHPAVRAEVVEQVQAQCGGPQSHRAVVHLAPSQARAIASALLSAATEARK